MKEKDRNQILQEIEFRYNNPIYGLNDDERKALIAREILDHDILIALSGGKTVGDFDKRGAELNANEHLKTAQAKKDLADAV